MVVVVAVVVVVVARAMARASARRPRKLPRANVAIYIAGSSIWIETGGNYGSMGAVVFGRGEDRTRGGDTSCDATENLW